MHTTICEASDCNNIVVQVEKMKPRKYCSERCAQREWKRIQRKKLVESGLCTICREPMDNPKSKRGHNEEIKYCSKCQQLYSQRYLTIKGIG